MAKKQINCWIQESVYKKVEERASRLGMKPSSYGSLIIENWIKRNEPLTPIEKELEAMRKLKEAQ